MKTTKNITQCESTGKFGTFYKLGKLKIFTGFYKTLEEAKAALKK